LEISKEQLLYIAELARMELPEDDLANLTYDLQEVLRYTEDMSNLHLDETPIRQELPADKWRIDGIEASQPIELTLGNSFESKGSYVEVPSVLPGQEEEI
jgi:aspartyl-tRNA(Asn)/glutamyl-tRNA(Gln) amidotransferase subunit C